MNKKTGVSSIEVIRVMDGKGEEVVTPFSEIDDSMFQEEEEFFDVYDMEFDNSLVTSSEYAKFLAFRRRMEEEEADANGHVAFRLPRQMSWGALGGAVIVVAQIVIGTFLMYSSQAGHNDRTDIRLAELEEQIETLKNETYSKKEEDLRYENLKLEILKHKEMLDIIKEQHRGGVK